MADLANEPGRGRLTGRTAVVVGGGSAGEGIGNGRATSIVLAREGANVLVVDRSESAALRTVELIASEGGTASAFAADCTSDDECREAIAAAVARYGSIEVLVNNIGVVGSLASVLDIDLDEWDAMMTVNVKPFVLMSRHAVPHMGVGGSIVNVASIAGIMATERIQYSASKSAILGLTYTMAAQQGRAGIRVNAVIPGAVWTPLVENTIPDSSQIEARREARRLGNMLGQEGTGWDIAYAILFLASDDSGWITGQTIVVDGGLSKQMAS